MTEKHANSVRRNLVKMMTYSKSSHIGSCLSVVDILTVLYFKILRLDLANIHDPERDVFVLSKGHASAALYAVLAERGVISTELLDAYYVDGGTLPGHLDMHALPGVECSAGSLGHGLSIGVGLALGKLKNGNGGRVFVLIGDGEANEGSVWEAIMLASSLRLKNLTLIVDFNHLQGMGRDVIDQANLSERLRAFGFESEDVDGHDHKALLNSLGALADGPRAIVAHTVKGKGIGFMEDRLEWHYKSPNEDQAAAAYRELER